MENSSVKAATAAPHRAVPDGSGVKEPGNGPRVDETNG